MSLSILFFACLKESISDQRDGSTQAVPDKFILDYPKSTTPGYFTMVKAILNEPVIYPVVIHWYSSCSLFRRTLQQVDTITYGNKAWYTFNYPQLFNMSQYSKGPLYVHCVLQENDGESNLEKTIWIDSTK